MKIMPMICIWMFVCAMNFWAARNGKKNEILDFQAHPARVSYFIHILYVNGVLEKVQ